MAVFYQKLRKYFNIARDVVIADLTSATPNAMKWLYRTLFSKEIKVLPLQEIDSDPKFNFTRMLYGKRALLYLHGDKVLAQGSSAHVVLILHGVHGHPLSMLHLADIAKESIDAFVFSLYLPYDENMPEKHRDLFKNAIDEVEAIVARSGCRLKGIVAVGHSLGAIEAAFRAFVIKDQRIASVISIAGRLRIDSSMGMSCRESLKSTVEKVFQGIQKFSDLPLYQIVGSKDWNAPLEATAVRPDLSCCCIVENAMHLNVLYREETKIKFAEFLKKSVSDRLNIS